MRKHAQFLAFGLLITFAIGCGSGGDGALPVAQPASPDKAKYEPVAPSGGTAGSVAPQASDVGGEGATQSSGVVNE